MFCSSNCDPHLPIVDAELCQIDILYSLAEYFPGVTILSVVGQRRWQIDRLSRALARRAEEALTCLIRTVVNLAPSIP